MRSPTRSVGSIFRGLFGHLSDKQEFDNLTPEPKEQARRQKARRQQIRVERQRGWRVAETGMAKHISKVLSRTKQTRGAEVIIMGYSPTGGGHTGRTLNILRESLSQNRIVPGSTVIMYVPSIWSGKARPDALHQLANQLTEKNVNVILMEADKSVLGFLKQDGSGASDDAAILNEFAEAPRRPLAQCGSILQGHFYQNGENRPAFDAIQTIHANHLVDSVLEQMEGDTSKMRILTDMDPALQKAAATFQIPEDQRVDQQNHAILLTLDDTRMAENLQADKGLLAKVLSGKGEKVAHIGLGDKNTLLDVRRTATFLGLNPNTPDISKAEVRRRVAHTFLQNGRTVNVNDAHPQGVIANPNLQAGQVKNIVYVYANENQKEIAKAVQNGVRKGEDDPHWNSTVFVFLGPNTFTDQFKANNPSNALHYAYLADADGITTAGAGTNGEFAYLNKHGQARANLFVIPIAGHNEQQANANFLRQDPDTADYVRVYNNTSTLGLTTQVRGWINSSYDQSPRKYIAPPAPPGETSEPPVIRPMLGAISDTETYPHHASRLLHGRSDGTSEEQKIALKEQLMRNEAVLKANRRFVKLIFQALNDIDRDRKIPPNEREKILAKMQAEPQADPKGTFNIKALASLRIGSSSKGKAKVAPSEPMANPIRIKYNQRDRSQTFGSVEEFARMLNDPEHLKHVLGTGLDVTTVLPMLNNARTVFDALAGDEIDNDNLDRTIQGLKEEFGNFMTTGF